MGCATQLIEQNYEEAINFIFKPSQPTCGCLHHVQALKKVKLLTDDVK